MSRKGVDPTEPQLPIDPTDTDEANAYKATHAGSRAAAKNGGAPNMPPPSAVPHSPLGLSPQPAPFIAVARDYVEERYEVLEPIEIVKGASRFLLSRGQIVTSAGFDMDTIKLCGAKLKRLEPRIISASKAVD